MWVKGSVSFPFPFQFFPRAIARRRKKQIARKRYEVNHGEECQWEGGERGGGINAQHTIQCESFGNPCTAAGPKARAVFIAAPVYGTANLKIWLA
jgi:hypothetical protein